MKYLLFLSLLTYGLYGFSQVKSYYIDYKGKKVSESDAFFKRSVEKEGKNWIVTDMYLNDTMQMTGSYSNRGLTKKTGKFHYYYINGRSKTAVNYQNNKKEGLAYYFNINGKPDQIRNYDKDELTGNYKKYDEFGNLERDINSDEIEKYYVKPEYHGGRSSLMAYLSSIKYPEIDEETRYIANPLASFTLDTNGKARNIDMVIGGTDAMNKEIILLLEKMPKWYPGIYNGKKAEYTYFVPFNFQVPSSNVRVNTKPKKMAKGFHISAVKDYKNNEFKSAIMKLEEAIKKDNMEAENYLLLGLCYNSLNNEDFAIEYWKIAHSLDNNVLPIEIKKKLNEDNK